MGKGADLQSRLIEGEGTRGEGTRGEGTRGEGTRGEGTLLQSRAAARTGSNTSHHWIQSFICPPPLHSITIQMNLKMKSEQLAEAAGAAKAAQQARAAPAVRKPVEGPARRSRRLA